MKKKDCNACGNTGIDDTETNHVSMPCEGFQDGVACYYGELKRIGYWKTEMDLYYSKYHHLQKLLNNIDIMAINERKGMDDRTKI